MYFLIPPVGLHGWLTRLAKIFLDIKAALRFTMQGVPIRKGVDTIFTVALTIYTATFSLSLFVLIVAVFRRKVKHLRFFTLFLFAATIYSLSFIMELLSLDLSAELQACVVQYLGCAFVPPLWMFFVMDFCNVKIRPTVAVSCLLIPVATFILVLTYPYNGLYYGEVVFTPGLLSPMEFTGSIYRTVFFIYSYAILFASFLICLIVRLKRDENFKRHSKLLLIAMIAPTLGNMISVFFNIVPFDITAICYTIMSIIVCYLLMFTGLFHLAPLAREEIVENMHDGFILVDSRGRFLDANRVAKQLFPELDSTTVGTRLEHLKTIQWDSLDDLQLQSFSRTTEFGEKYYSASSSKILHNNQTLCTCISIYDSTSVHNLMAEVTRMAEFDHLTGLLNRRTFIRDAQKKHDEIKRYENPAFLLMIDIDYFKNVNDTYGHLAGDEVLHFVAKILTTRFRNTDIVGRYGGEEFCLLMPSINEVSASNIAEKCRELIEHSSITYEDKTINITISIGMAELTGDLSLTAVFANADAALYKAKEDGRNRVVVYRVKTR